MPGPPMRLGPGAEVTATPPPPDLSGPAKDHRYGLYAPARGGLSVGP